MSYRFVRITNNYPQYISSFYAKNSDAKAKSYQHQYADLVEDSVDIALAYTKNLNKIGVEAYDIITNAYVLQDTWKKENNVPQEISTGDLIIKQLEQYKPDVIWMDDFSFLNKVWKQKLQQKVPSVKLFLGHVCAPYSTEMIQTFKLLDVMFTCIPCFKSDFDSLGINTYLLYHAFDSSVLSRVSQNNTYNASELLFSGSLYTGSGFHNTRIEYIEKMLAEGIKIDLYCNTETRKKILLKKTFYVVFNLFKKIGLSRLITALPLFKANKAYASSPPKAYSSKLLNSCKPPVFGMDMYKLLSKANIVFNMHGEVANKCAGNIRLFEATGLGICLVSDWKENISDLFEPDKEIITYKTPEECIEKIKWLIANPEKRKQIAKAGQEKTLSKHTIEKRAKYLNEIIIAELNKRNEFVTPQ